MMRDMMKAATMVNDRLYIGVIQTSLDAEAAWVDDKSGNWEECVRMSAIEERRAKKEIRHHLASLRGVERQPDIIVLPELSVPLGFVPYLKKAAEKLESIIIAGLDYRIEKNETQPTVSNEAVVIVPRRLRGRQVAHRTEVRRVGKTYPAPAEKLKLKEIISSSVAFQGHPTVWIFESPELGKFAVAICYDFMDLDRIVMYRNKIQTLFILAYNKDTTSFDHLAEALSRMLFCNVVVCNCGQFGGSLAVSPFRESYLRSVYHHGGQGLPHAQIIQLPLAELVAHQRGKKSKDFKSLPPGFAEFEELSEKMETI
jgi:predicted amidohydrolase